MPKGICVIQLVGGPCVDLHHFITLAIKTTALCGYSEISAVPLNVDQYINYPGLCYGNKAIGLPVLNEWGHG